MIGKRSEEKRILALMVESYCRKKHGAETLCADCSALIDYAVVRLDKCVFGDEKPACQYCPIHCYQPAMRAKIREVMRWAGPRMIFIYPRSAIRHWWSKTNKGLRKPER